jgi:hypothetical protein
MKYMDFLRESALKKEVIDRFLNTKAANWARFDPELGYTLGNFMPRDGIDGSLTISTSQENSARTAIMYADRPCRINTYGNSFTQCHQVSDHETWQEYLAAHLGEPVRNFGMGGYGVYQAYHRMVRTEKGPDSAPYVILYLWDDDHRRSLLRCRYAICHRWFEGRTGMFHGNPWVHLELDLNSGKFVEKPSLLPTPESLYRLTDPEWMIEHLRDDWMMQMIAFVTGLIDDPDVESLSRLSQALGRRRLNPTHDLKQQIDDLHNAFSFAATYYTVGRAAEFIESQRKQLLVVTYAQSAARQLVETGRRYDQPVVDFLRERDLRTFDMTPVHVDDFKKNFKIPYSDYMKRMSIGHYNPAGNHFFAYAIKNTIVEWLDPKPLPYRSDEQAEIGFEGYLAKY